MAPSGASANHASCMADTHAVCGRLKGAVLPFHPSPTGVNRSGWVGSCRDSTLGNTDSVCFDLRRSPAMTRSGLEASRTASSPYRLRRRHSEPFNGSANSSYPRAHNTCGTGSGLPTWHFLCQIRRFWHFFEPLGILFSNLAYWHFFGIFSRSLAFWHFFGVKYLNQ